MKFLSWISKIVKIAQGYGGLKRIQKIPKDSKRFQKIPRDSKRFH